jgi:hypothetical protein
MRRFTKLMIVGLTLMLTQVAVYAQATGSLSGSVSDPNGASVPGASVIIRKADTGDERRVTTNDRGAFSFDLITPGNYVVTVEIAGFKKAVASDVIVQVSKESQLSISLEIGAATETVTVTSGQEVINSSSPTLTSVINTRQVADLPLGNRNPLELAALQAGIAVVGTDVRGASVAGLRQTATNVSQDGINAMDMYVKTSSFFAISTPSLASTAEFSITTGTTSSESGRGVVQVNLVTKGGTNDYHGGVFGQLINDWANSNTYFNNFNGTSRPLLHQKYWGGDIGGPIHFLNFGEGVPKHWSGKDKAFFFFSFERFSQVRAASRNRSGVLTQEARNGTFRYLRTCPVAPAPLDPNCTGGIQTVNLLTHASVPFHSLNPLMTAHIGQIPLPNNFNCAASDNFNIGCFTFNVAENTTNNKYVGRYDHQLVKDTGLGSHKLEFVYSRVDTNTYPDVFTNNVENPFPGGINAFQYSTRSLVTPALVSSFGSNWTNVLRYGRQWAPVVFDRDTFPTAPFISLPGVLVNYDNNNLAQPRNTLVNQLTDSVSWVKGNHLVKFGGDWQSVLTTARNDGGIVQTIQLGAGSTNNPTGLTAATLPGASSAAVTAATTTYSAIVGLLASSTKTFNVTSPTSGFVDGATQLRTFQQKDLALFIQDQWRFRPNVTVSAGVRWDYQGVPTIPNGLALGVGNYSDLFGVSGFGNIFKPTSSLVGVPAAVAKIDFVSGTTGRGLYNNDWNNFAPFVGLAYSPNFKSGPFRALFGDAGKSSIRLGYAISYLHDGLTVVNNAIAISGLAATANISSVNNSNNLTGQLTAAGVPLVTPTYSVPTTDRANIVANSGNGIRAFDPNLRTPYVQQWNIGFEREIFKDTALEVRYVGNRALKVWRAVDYNEVNIFENGFLQEFKNAQINLAARGGTSFAPNSAASPCAACVALPIFDRFFGIGFAGVIPLAASLGYGSSTFITALNPVNNNVGAIASTLAFNTSYRANRENATIGIPQNFFVANPNAAFARGLSNDAMSNYNALEIEIRRRFSGGLQFQADYTWSKAMGNATDGQGNNQSDLINFRTLRNTQLDYRRSGQDQTQRFVANAVYDLPFGNGKPFLDSSNGVLNRIVGGWSVGSIVTWATGAPWYVAANKSTFNNQTANNGAQLLGISYEDFKKNVGLFRVPGGILFINPEILNLTISSTTGKITGSTLKAGLMGAPAPGTFGNFPINELSGPQYFNVDLSLIKRIPITETVRFEMKINAINVLNHANFAFGTPNFDSATFGLITTQRDSGRNMSIIGALRF